VTDLGDGRLELDDLGSVIEHASSLDAPPTVEVLEGSDAATWTERLESAGVAPWLRRRRIPLVAVGAVLAVGAVAGIAWRQSQPPPLDPTVAATAVDAMAAMTVTEIPGAGNGDLWSGAVTVTSPVADDRITVLGVEGPGIRASSAAPDPQHADAGVTADVFAVPGCDDPRSLSPALTSYRLLVRRTDSFDRTTDGTIAMPDSLAAQLAATSQQTCVQTFVDEQVVVRSLTFVTDLAHRTVRMAIDLHNGTGSGLSLMGGSIGSSTVVVSTDPVDLPAGAEANVPVTATVVDCEDPRLDPVRRPGVGDPGAVNTFSGLGLYAALTASADSAGTQINVRFTPDQTREVQAAFARMCLGAPAVRATVLDAAAAPSFAASALGYEPTTTISVIRMHVAVGTVGATVRSSDGSVLPTDVVNGGPRQMTSATAPVVRGRAVLTIDWGFTCDQVTNPPSVNLVVTGRGTAYPFTRTLGQSVVTEAYSNACPSLPRSDLQGFGWTIDGTG
jgi:hypothetical protein